MTLASRLTMLLVIIMTCGLTGCGSSGPSSEITGKVLLDGQPLAGAQIQLLPKGDAVLGMHSTTTDSNGDFHITETGASNNPIRPGSYVVLVSKMTMKPDAANQPGGGMDATVNEVPALYLDRALTPLSVEVTSNSTQLKTLELSSKPDGGKS